MNEKKNSGVNLEIYVYKVFLCHFHFHLLTTRAMKLLQKWTYRTCCR